MKRAGDERGSVTGFAVCLVLALVLAGGLVFDGGRLVSARIRAGDLAENAARAGAQELMGLREGDWHLDPAKAVARAEAFLAATGASGTAVADGTEVSVTVSSTTSMTLLALIGVGSRRVEVTRTAQAVDR